jgi:hypothetical protein
MLIDFKAIRGPEDVWSTLIGQAKKLKAIEEEHHPDYKIRI